MKPADAKQLRDAVAWAAAEGEALDIVSGGSKAALGRPGRPARKLDVSALSGGIEYEPEELVLTCGAATPMREILLLLEQRAQMLAFEPPDFGALYGLAPDGGTIGGALAANLAGPRRVKMGSARDHFLGFSGVSGRGEEFKAGGRVVKNVTGYDLPKLIAGSMGTLAVLDRVTVKVMPAAPKARTVLVFGLDPARAVAAMSEALNSPWEVSGAAYLPANVAKRSRVDHVAGAGTSVTAIRVEGTAVSVAARCAALRESLGAFGAIEELHSIRTVDFWREVRDVAPLLPDATRAMWRVSVAPTQGPAVAASASGADWFLDWGGGLVWLAVPASGDAGAAKLRAAYAEGHATLMRAPDAIRSLVPVFEPAAPGVAALNRGVKAQFDPRAILNPGRMYEGL
ncbi:MAG: glycolate oxidase subunit GlcE [Rhodospirillales bacterium]|nr:glycolate oxidase subunit GlcE [Rhodospirillales bacterium]